MLLSVENKPQRDQLGAQTTVLHEAKEEARVANNAKSLAEDQSKKDIAELNATILDRDRVIAERDPSLPNATERAETAERAKKTLEDIFKSSSSDHDSVLYIYK